MTFWGTIVFLYCGSLPNYHLRECKLRCGVIYKRYIARGGYWVLLLAEIEKLVIGADRQLRAAARGPVSSSANPASNRRNTLPGRRSRSPAHNIRPRLVCWRTEPPRHPCRRQQTGRGAYAPCSGARMVARRCGFVVLVGLIARRPWPRPTYQCTRTSNGAHQQACGSG